MRTIGRDFGDVARKTYAVASGALGNGKACIVNSDGTVSVITGSSITQAQGSEVTWTTNSPDKIQATYDSNADRVVVVYRDVSNSGYGTAVIGTVSGTSISFGTAVVFQSYSLQASTVTFDSTNNKVVMYFCDTANRLSNQPVVTGKVGTVSGSSISFGTKAALTGNPTMPDSGYIHSCFDSNAGKSVVLFEREDNSNYGTAAVGTVSGTSISFGALAVFESADTDYIKSGFDSTSNKVMAIYRDVGNSGKGTIAIGTVSGTSISFGTPVVYNDASTQNNCVVHDSGNNKNVIAFRDAGNSNYGTIVVGTISGTSISFGSKVVFQSATSASSMNSAYDVSVGKVVILITTSSSGSAYGSYNIGTVSGTSITMESLVTYSGRWPGEPAIMYDSTSERIVSVYKDNTDNSGRSQVLVTGGTSTNLTSENYIGITPSAYPTGAGAEIQTKGAINEEQSGLTAGQSYYVQTDGTLGTTADAPSVFAGTAVSATKIIVKG